MTTICAFRSIDKKFWVDISDVTPADLEWLRGVPKPTGARASVGGLELAVVVQHRIDGNTLKRTGELIGKTQERARQMEAKALRLMSQKRQSDAQGDSLDRLFLNVRSANGLKNEGCKTISQAITMLDSGRLRRVPNLGKKSLDEIAAKLEPFR